MTDMLKVARSLLARGLSVFPLDHPDDPRATDPKSVGKVPIIKSWAPFQKERPTDEHLIEWFGNGLPRNAAITTGALSDVIVVDGDSPEGLAWMRAHLPISPMRTQTPRPGEHWYYQHPGVPVRNKARIKTGDPAVKIDLRGDGGYAVAPGSLHYTRIKYAALGTWPAISELPRFDPAWVEPEPASPPADPAEPRVVAEGRRNDVLFREGCRLRRYGFDQTEIGAALRAINAQRCRPPLDAQEIEAIAASCAKYEPTADTFPLTEQGDAEFFAVCNADTVRYQHPRGSWFLFSDQHWTPQTDGEVARRALEACRARQRAAVGDKDRLRWALGGESRRRQSNLIALAQDILPLADRGDGWDLDPWLLGAANGVIDLQAGTLRPGRPEDRITMRVRPAFDPDATCPLWDQTLEEIFGDDTDLIDYFDRYVGYSTTGDSREETVALCWGGGANGKGTLLNTLGWVLGDYADDLPFSALELHHRAAIPNDIAKIVGKRFVTSSETAETRRLNEARVKALTGRDPITARFLHREFFTFQPVAKFWLATNHKPVVRDTSVGFWRRLHLIPFTQSFAAKPDLQLKDKLRGEAAGILARAVRGCLAWQRDGLNPPAAVQEATQHYREASMPLARFFDECCVIGDNTRATFGQLFEAYKKWHGESREPRLGRHAFNEALRERFTTDPQDTQRVTFLGIGLLAPQEEEEA